MSRITKISAREILDSRGNPTVEAEIETDGGIFIASVPSGASTGLHEAVELRDGDKDRFNGKGVLNAVKNINEIISPKLIGENPENQEKIDGIMKELDGTENKSRLGANAILAVSIAVCRAGAASGKMPLYKYLSRLWDDKRPIRMPRPCFNIINGGAHAGNELDIQEFMVIPSESSFAKNLETGTEIYGRLKQILKDALGKDTINVGDEGGFAPPIKSAKEALDFLSSAIQAFSNVQIGIDCAASQFFKNGEYVLSGKKMDAKQLAGYYSGLINSYPIVFIEDPYSEEDFDGFSDFEKLVGSKIDIIADDLTATNTKRMEIASGRNACSGFILKPNQIGTVTESLKAASLAKSYGWKTIVSHRSGDTNDDFIADLSVGIGAEFIKSGAPAREERVAKYNRLLKIEEELK